MSAHEELMRRVMSAINDGNADQLRDDLSDDVVHHTATGDYAGRDSVIGLYQTLREQAGWVITPLAVVATDDWGSAIHRNSFHGATYEVTTSGRIRDGKVAELWTVGMPALELDRISTPA